MAYAEKNLVPGESIVYRARYHWIYYRATFAILAVAVAFGFLSWTAGKRGGNSSGPFLTIALLVLASAGAVFLFTRFRASVDEFVVTNRRVIKRTGLVAHEVDMAPIEKIQDIAIYQDGIRRLLGCGQVALETASERGRMVFPNIADPEKFRSAIWGQSAGAASGGVPASPGAPVGTFAGSVQVSTATRLAELENLHKQGLLTADEYLRKREEILGSL
jgi:membrane protein YdbS with pleckstrin-like domain